MSPWRSRLTWLAVGAIIAAASFLWRERDESRHDLVKAAGRGEVQVSMQGAGPSQAVVTVTRPSGAGVVDLRLPAGVIIGDPQGERQRLMTAVMVPIHFAVGQTSVQATVETYCLDPLKLPPDKDTSLAFEEMGGGGGDDGKLRKLAECLAPQFPDHGERQLAVWLVSTGYVDKPREAVRADLQSKLRDLLKDHLEDNFEARFAAKFREKAPNATDDQVRAQLSRFPPEVRAHEVEVKASLLAQGYLSKFEDAAPLLEKCGYPRKTQTYLPP